MEPDYRFAFNNAHFADRLLLIKINGGASGGDSDVLDLSRDRKRRKMDANNVKELHISTPILAGKSPFFYKLFSNGMLESNQKKVTLRIDASEEDALMELLKFVYTNTVSATTAHALLDVLTIADKYEVISCMNYCSRLLLDTPMTVDFALRVLDLPPCIMASDSVMSLLNATKQFITSQFKDMDKLPLEEVIALPLVFIEAILESNELEIDSEDVLYDTILQWVKANYTDQQERQQILGSLARLIRFPRMAYGKLMEIVHSGEFSPILSSEILFTTESMHHKRRLPRLEESLTRHPWFTQRAYKYIPIHVLEFEIPLRTYIVNMDLTRQECARLYPSGPRHSSLSFQVLDTSFFFYTQCKMDQTTSSRLFQIFLAMHEPILVRRSFHCKVFARMQPAGDFVQQFKFTGDLDGQNKSFFSIPWESFVADESPYFVNDILHLQVELYLFY